MMEGDTAFISATFEGQAESIVTGGGRRGVMGSNGRPAGMTDP